ncbi:MAG: putative TIM-barrel enzyme [Paracoccaceae bacterium]|jgi:predicted TIM-barrel enzyme|tara:strand:- start:632 stop:1381 length:750 start_codon:yes stop_codon:yes gene_type:complete
MINRNAFHKFFKTPGPVVLPVIHVLDSARTARNIGTVIEGGAQGCFLINHDFEKERLIPIVRDMRAMFPSLWMGVNFLAVTGKEAFPVLAQMAASGCEVDAYWADDARIDEDGTCADATEIADIRAQSGWNGLYFGGTAFKKQRKVSPARYGDAARNACSFMDVVTTSGVATGEQADLTKIETFRAAIKDRPLALASGITPENAMSYRDVDCFMVATGISAPSNFYDIDPVLLAQLTATCRKIGKGTTR